MRFHFCRLRCTAVPKLSIYQVFFVSKGNILKLYFHFTAAGVLYTMWWRYNVSTLVIIISGSNISQGIWRMLMHWKTMFDRCYCIKTKNICYISRYFFHYMYFVSPFPRCCANAISWTMLVLGQGSTNLAAAILWPLYEHIESCVAVH